MSSAGEAAPGPVADPRAGAATPTRFLRQGFWAVADQGLFAVSNFLINVMLARSLTPVDYGAFTVAFTVFLLLGTAHTALLTEPMLVFGPSRYRDHRTAYLGALMEGHWTLTAAVGILLVAAGGVVRAAGGQALATALIGLGITAPFILLPWLLRRACYVRMEPWRAAVAGGLYLAAVVAGLAFLSARALLSVPAALGVMGGASLLVGAWLAFRLRVRLLPAVPREMRRDALRQHWVYGRWSAGTLALSWIPGNIYYLVLPAQLGLQASAGLKVLMNLILPVQHVNTALAVLLVPTLVRARGRREFSRLVRAALGLFAAGSFTYWSLLMAAHRPILAWLYRGQYGSVVPGLWPLGAFLLLTVVVSVLGSALRALERPDQVFRANAAATVVALTAGAWLAVRWGVTGAAVALALGAAVKAGSVLAYYRRSGEPRRVVGGERVVSAPHAF